MFESIPVVADTILLDVCRLFREVQERNEGNNYVTGNTCQGDG